MNLEVVEMETLLILLKNVFDFLLELGGPVSRWIFSVPNFLEIFLFVHLRRKNKFSFFLWEISPLSH